MGPEHRQSRPRHARASGLALLGAALLISGCAGVPLAKEQKSIADLAEQAGATSLSARKLDDGGLLLNGKLGGNNFSVAIPWQWNHQAVVFANGYRSPGLPTDIPDNPLKDDNLGYYRNAFGQGFATGVSAYAKSGLAVKAGVEATLRLKQLVQKIGAKKTYVMGGSMGGNITEALVEQHPDDFAGAVSFCGAVGGMRREVIWAQDVRAVYNYLARGTAYALPGDQSIAQSAIWLPSGAWPRAISFPLLMVQFKRIASPMLALFSAAQKNPSGPEARLIDNMVEITGIAKDPAGLFAPLLLVATGMDDMNATFGGSVYDNSAKVYHSKLMSKAENAALNAGVERIKADPEAVKYAIEWHDPTGKFKTRLMTVYNAIDPLVPDWLHETPLREAALRVGTQDHLVQRSVPSRRGPMLSLGEVYQHCGFEKEQVAQAWSDMRAWVEHDKKPR